MKHEFKHEYARRNEMSNDALGHRHLTDLFLVVVATYNDYQGQHVKQQKQWHLLKVKQHETNP